MNAIDNQVNVLYFVCRTASTTKFHKMHALTGAYLGSFLVDPPMRDLHGPQVNANGRLLAWRWNGTAEEFYAIDPSTGRPVYLSTIPEITELYQNASGNHANVLYIDCRTASTTKFPKVDALTGAYLGAFLLAPHDGSERIAGQ